MEKNRKAQVGMEGLISGFTIVGAVLFLIVLLVYVFAVIGTGMETTATSNSVSNDTAAAINNTGYQLASGITGNPRTFSISQARNGTSGLVISSPNFTVSSSGLLTNATARVWPVVHLDYSYYNDSASITASKTAQSNSSRAIPLVGILFIILAVAAVITILVVSLLGRKRV